MFLKQLSSLHSARGSSCVFLGLKNAAQAFQRLIDTVLLDLDFTFTYIDDILVASRNKAEHMVHLRQVLERLQQHGLVVNLAKCQYGRQELDFRITYRIAPLPSMVDTIREFAKPTTVKGLQEFTSMVNFYHRFVPQQHALCNPCTTLWQGSPKSCSGTRT